MDKRDLAAVWTVLESNPPQSAIEAVSIGYTVEAGDLLAGIDSDGHRAGVSILDLLDFDFGVS